MIRRAMEFQNGQELLAAARWAEGRSIGSGMVEGACKTAIGLRRKPTGVRWRV